MSILSHLENVYKSVIDVLDYGQSPPLLAIRLYWGWQFAQSGWGKLHRITQVTEFFSSLGLPQPHLTAICVALVEFVGGILFALGIGSRIIALMLFVNVSVAYSAADREALGQILANPGKFYAADPYTFWFAAVVILIFGPGFWAIDSLLDRFGGASDESR